jgi:hypothetical protein
MNSPRARFSSPKSFQILGTVDSRATENFFASRVFIHMDKIDAASRADPQLKEELP